MTMFVAACQIEILIPYAQSLKDKRQVVKSLLAQIKNKFNVAAAEVDDLDYWQKAVIGIAAISNSAYQAEDQINTIIQFVEGNNRFEVANVSVEIL